MIYLTIPQDATPIATARPCATESTQVIHFGGFSGIAAPHQFVQCIQGEAPTYFADHCTDNQGGDGVWQGEAERTCQALAISILNFTRVATFNM